jgi:hypothetical protein
LFQASGIKPQLPAARIGLIRKAGEAVGGMDDRRQAECLCRRGAGVFVKGDCLDDSVSQAPKTEQIGTDVGVGGEQKFLFCGGGVAVAVCRMTSA